MLTITANLLAATEGAWSAYRWGFLLLVPVLVLLNAFFVAAEFALVMVRRTQVEEMLHKGVRWAGALHWLKGRLDHAIAATQLGITMTSIGLGWVGEPAVAQLLQPLLQSLSPEMRWPAVRATSTALAFALVTFLHVAFGELAPKAVALQRPARVALWVAWPMWLFARMTRPLVWFMNGIGNLAVRALGLHRISDRDMVHSVEELAMIVEEIEEAGLLTPEQADYVQNVFRLRSKKVRDCMVPRDRMVALELHTPPDKILEICRTSAHTRMPVYEGDVNNVIGIVNTKDLFYLFSLKGVVILQDALYPPIFLKPEQPIADALRLFQRAKRPMAVVRDDTGQVLGLITLEDILEEIVGDIEDEHDRPIPRRFLRRRT
ncbi:MAG: hemolysin family protein [Gemmatales bacterium]|nr:hemolysin family protein [Gemmatales bacterium]